MSQLPESPIASSIPESLHRYNAQDLLNLLGKVESMHPSGLDLQVQIQMQGSQDLVSARLVKKPNGQFELRDMNNQVISLGDDVIIVLDSDAEFFLGIKKRDSGVVDRAEIRDTILGALARPSDGITATDAAFFMVPSGAQPSEADVDSSLEKVSSVFPENEIKKLLLDQKKFREDECVHGGMVPDILNQIQVTNPARSALATKALLIDSSGQKRPVVIAKIANSEEIYVCELMIGDDGNQTIGQPVSSDENSRIHVTDHDKSRLRIIRTQIRKV